MGLGLLSYMILNWYWKVQMMYNTTSLSLYTPPFFGISNREKLEHYTKLGYKYAPTQKIIIATMVRDVINNIPAIKSKAEKIGGLFSDYRVLIVENNSTDGTREALLAWSKSNPKVIILGCGVNAKTCNLTFAKAKTIGHGVDRNRIDKMTHLRNIYLDYVKNNTVLYDFDYTMIWDLDIVGIAYVDGIANSIGHFMTRKEVKVLTSYGIYRWGYLTLYYDTYAHLDLNEKELDLKKKSEHDIKKGLGIKTKRGDDLIEITSGFGGMSIYRTNVLLDDKVRYTLSPGENIECEHVRLHKSIGRGIFMNPSMINYVLKNE